jgi:hypothetical protein
MPEGDPEEVRARQTLALGKRMFDRVVQDRALIPKGNLVEIRYEDLVGHEMAHIERIYDTLRLQDWAAARPVLERYLDGVEGYQRNKLRLDKARRDDVWNEWRVMFDTYGYEREFKVG